MKLLRLDFALAESQKASTKDRWNNSMNLDAHNFIVLNESPDGAKNFDDAVELVDKLRADDAYARHLADNGLDFARKYLTLEVMLVYLRELLLAYKDLFEDMDEYVSKVGDTGNSALFMKQAQLWNNDWRTVKLCRELCSQTGVLVLRLSRTFNAALALAAIRLLWSMRGSEGADVLFEALCLSLQGVQGGWLGLGPDGVDLVLLKCTLRQPNGKRFLWSICWFEQTDTHLQAMPMLTPSLQSNFLYSPNCSGFALLVLASLPNTKASTLAQKRRA
eukprot:1143685-Pelagomonas_calceolata.AAC.2